MPGIVDTAGTGRGGKTQHNVLLRAGNQLHSVHGGGGEHGAIAEAVVDSENQSPGSIVAGIESIAEVLHQLDKASGEVANLRAALHCCHSFCNSWLACSVLVFLSFGVGFAL
ncbi:MAG: hypothetical protein U0Q16_16135 [Bryobacteraceae bacterium]